LAAVVVQSLIKGKLQIGDYSAPPLRSKFSKNSGLQTIEPLNQGQVAKQLARGKHIYPIVLATFLWKIGAAARYIRVASLDPNGDALCWNKTRGLSYRPALLEPCRRILESLQITLVRRAEKAHLARLDLTFVRPTGITLRFAVPVTTWKVSCNLLNLRKQFTEGFFSAVFVSP
jgi:hypothetical protein